MNKPTETPAYADDLFGSPEELKRAKKFDGMTLEELKEYREKHDTGEQLDAYIKQREEALSSAWATGRTEESDETDEPDESETPTADDSMFEIKEQHRRVLAQLAEIDRYLAENAGVYRDEEMEKREKELESKLWDIEGSLEEKYRRYGWAISEVQAKAESLNARAEEYQEIIDRIFARAERMEKRAEKMKQRIREDMIFREVEEVDCDDFVFVLHWKSHRKTNVLSPPEQLPDRFRREKINLKYSAGEVDEDARETLRAVVESIGAQTGKTVTFEPYPDKRALSSALKEGDPEAEKHARLADKQRKLVVK